MSDWRIDKVTVPEQIEDGSALRFYRHPIAEPIWGVRPLTVPEQVEDGSALRFFRR